MDMNWNQKPVLRSVLKIFCILFLSISAIILAAASLFYQQEVDAHLSMIETREHNALETQRLVITDEFDSILGDLLFLSHQNELLQFLDDSATETLKGIESEYLALATTKHIYDQIRFLDQSGLERVRINYNNGNPAVVAKTALQNKRSRYYFTDSFALDAHEIFVSPLDLNIEHGHVELPIKPMLRFATPLFDRHGEKRGIILLNYLASHLLDRILRSGGNNQHRKALLNAQGYWLLSSTKEDEWGFMFDNGKQKTFGNAFPMEWKTILKDGKGQLRTQNGLFTFQTIAPIEETSRLISGIGTPDGSASLGNCSKGLFWVLLSTISPEELETYPRNLLYKMIFLNTGMLLLVAIGSWQLALAITRRRMYQAHLIALAMYDSLTDLPNRKLFFDQLTTGLDLAERYEHNLGLLYLDLDGFKQVNDTLGHEAGDELLVQVGIRLKSCVRKSDTVARLGGDEFAIVLPEANSAEGAMMAGQKIVNSISRPFTLKSGPVTIGVSIGVAVYPHHETSADGLIQEADQAMYRAKAKGKNTCVLAKE